MRILFCCQFYAPSVGGVQEVTRQIAERLVKHGHAVTVATSSLPNRSFETLNGVNIKGFAVSGNRMSGMAGEVAQYQNFVSQGAFDVMLVYASQQWTFDALWPVLDNISFCKVFVPCGFSGLYEPAYRSYFSLIVPELRKFDQLIFHATRYRDIELARDAGINNFVILPNGASEIEFSVEPDPAFRTRHDIAQDDFLFLTVGSFTGLKGHQELVEAFTILQLPPGRRATLVLNGNEVQRLERSGLGLIRKFVGLTRQYGIVDALRQSLKKLLGNSSSVRRVAEAINKKNASKRVLIVDLKRSELTEAYFAADLFVFASNIEYSPLVLFEAAAAGTPFLSVDVGNAIEIAEWTHAGVMCPSRVDERGYTHVDPAVLSSQMVALMVQPELLHQLGKAGRHAWAARFTWEKIVAQYEQLFNTLIQQKIKTAND